MQYATLKVSDLYEENPEVFFHGELTYEIYSYLCRKSPFERVKTNAFYE